MLSSRSQHALFVDKENSTAPSSRKPVATYTSSQAGLLKTPGVKQQHSLQQRAGAKSVKVGSSKQALDSTNLNGSKVAATVALEPGARVLGTKDGNNRATTGRLAPKTGNGKGKALDTVYDECTLMPAASTAKEGKGKDRSTSEVLKQDKKVVIQATPARKSYPAKTPARQTARPIEQLDGFASLQPTLFTPLVKVPNTLRKASPSQNSIMPSFSAFKTPSPNQLLRRRKGAGSPLPFTFNPTSLRSDDAGDEDLDLKPRQPTYLDELAAKHALIDDEQEVDCATRQAVNPEDLPVDLPFEMPDFKKMDVIGNIFKAAAWFGEPGSDEEEDLMPYIDDTAEYSLDQFYNQDFYEPPLFPIDDILIKSAAPKKTTPAVQTKSQLQAKPAFRVHNGGATQAKEPKTVKTQISRTAVGVQSRHPAPLKTHSSRLNAKPISSTTGLRGAVPRKVCLPISEYPEVVEFELKLDDMHP